MKFKGLEIVAGLPSVIRRLSAIEKQLKRVADLKELELRSQGVYLVDERLRNVEEPEIQYTDELEELAREIADIQGRKVE